MGNKLRQHGVHGPMGYYSNADDYLKYAKKNSMYKAKEKVITSNLDEINLSVKEGDHFMEVRLKEDGGYSYSTKLVRSEVIELIEKLAKVAEQLPK